MIFTCTKQGCSVARMLTPTFGSEQEDNPDVWRMFLLCCGDSVLRTPSNVGLFVLQRNKRGGGATSEGEARASAEEKDPLLQDDVD